jgi:hypothetical protein
MAIEMTDSATYSGLGTRGTVVVENLQDYRGGRSLDCTGFYPDYITEGHPVIKETATGKFKPMPTNVGMTAYASLPSGHVYVGVVVNHSVPKNLPMVGISYHGCINPETMPYDFSTIASAFKTAVPLISQIAD